MSEGHDASLKVFGPPPFDEDSSGDCILRSSDGVKFKAWRNILSLASPIFRDMFDIPQSAMAAPVDLPIIELTESPTTLHALLVLIYPITKRHAWTFHLAFDLAKTFDKYMLDADLLKPLEDLFRGDVFVTRPTEAYVLAWKLGRQEEAQKASRYLHNLDLDDADVKKTLLMAGDVEALVALWSLHHRREVALDTVIGVVPLKDYCCPDHMQERMEQLRKGARKALAVPFPVCRRVDTFFKFRELFGYLPSDFTFVCGACSKAFLVGKSIGQAEFAVNLAIERYPQTITWPVGGASSG